MTQNSLSKVSERRIAANRRNARKSTGPRTPLGKRNACRNRYKHGFYAIPDKKTREEMFRIGEDPDLAARFERRLARAWQPADDMQAMFVADLARLYADKAQMRKVLRATRLGELREQETAIERTDLALSHEEAIDESELRDLGYRGMKPSQAALDESQRLLTSLFERNVARLWGEGQEDAGGDTRLSIAGEAPMLGAPSRATNGLGESLSETFELLYGARPHGVGRMIIDLFGLLAEHPEKADVPLDDPEHGLTGTLRLQLATCIERERMAVMFEERHYQMQKAEEAAGDFGSEWLPGSENWGRAQMQDARMDRLIESKVKLLIRLKRLRHSLPEEFDGDLGPIDEPKAGFRSSGFGIRETPQPGPASAKPEARPVPTGFRENPNPAPLRSGVRKLLKNEVRSHHLIENKGGRSGTNPNTKPISCRTKPISCEAKPPSSGTKPIT